MTIGTAGWTRRVSSFGWGVRRRPVEQFWGLGSRADWKVKAEYLWDAQAVQAGLRIDNLYLSSLCTN